MAEDDDEDKKSQLLFKRDKLSDAVDSHCKSGQQQQQQQQQQQLQQHAVHMSDSDLIDLLRKPPKSVSMLRTKASFQDFFRGIESRRFRKLLQSAYDDIADRVDREAKIQRRMELMGDAFS
jgi:hypothetical protein